MFKFNITDDLKTFIGWLTTVVSTVFFAWLTITTRLYTVEKEIELLKQRTNLLEQARIEQVEILKEVTRTNTEIQNSLIRIEGVLNTKADKQWK